MRQDLLKLAMTVIIFGLTFATNKKKEQKNNEKEETVKKTINKEKLKEIKKDYNKLDSLEKNIKEENLQNLIEEISNGTILKNEKISNFFKAFSEKGKEELINKDLDKDLDEMFQLDEIENNNDKSDKISSADELIDQIRKERDSINDFGNFDESLEFKPKKEKNKNLESNFEKESLAHAIILSEILDKPVSLRD